MKLKKMFPLVTVKSLASLKDYCGHFGFAVTMEAQGYLHLAGSGAAEIAFMTQYAEAWASTCPTDYRRRKSISQIIAGRIVPSLFMRPVLDRHVAPTMYPQ